jgi:hypothetical protein
MPESTNSIKDETSTARCVERSLSDEHESLAPNANPLYSRRVKALPLLLVGFWFVATPASAQTSDACPEDRFAGKPVARAECYYTAGDSQRALTALDTDATPAGKALREKASRHVVVLRIDAVHAGDVKDLQVALDGAEPLADETSSELVLVKGEHAATVSRPGYQPWLLKLRYEPRDEPRADDLLVLEVPPLLPLSALGPRVNLRLETEGARGARLTIDGKETSEALIAFGNHEVRVEQPGRAAWGAAVELTADRSMPGAAPILTLSVPELESEAAPAPAPAPADTSGTRGSWYLPAAATGGIVAAVTSVVTLSLALSASADAEDELEQHNDLVRAGASETEIALARDQTNRSRGQRDALLNASLASAAAALAFGGVTLYFWVTDKEGAPSPGEKKAAGSGSMPLSQTPGTAGARASFAF